MSFYMLDTDTLSLLQQGHVTVLHQVNNRPFTEVALAVITLQEQMQGWQGASPTKRGWGTKNFWVCR